MKLLYLVCIIAMAVGLGMFLDRAIRSSAKDSAGSSDTVKSAKEEEAVCSSDDATEIALLRQQVAALRSQLFARGLRSPPAPGPVAAQESERSAASRERDSIAEKEAWANVIAKVDDGFHREPVDATWSVQAASALRTAVNKSEAIRKVPKNNVECRSRTCRIELTDSGEVEQNLPDFLMQVQSDLPGVTSQHEEDGAGNRILVLYLSRADVSVQAPAR